MTSSISEKFLPGILIGYISELNNDSNNLTKSGTVNPAVDFKHLQEVLVIRTKKVYVASEADASDPLPASTSTTTLTAPRAEDAAAAANQNAENAEGTQDQEDAQEQPDEAAQQGEGGAE